MSKLPPFLLALAMLAGCTDESSVAPTSASTQCASEVECYPMIDIPIPEHVALEVGGMAFMNANRLALATRRGEVWIIDDAYRTNGEPPSYSLFAQGLHEPLGLSWHDGSLFTAQRQELTKLIDTNGDDKADIYETVVDLPITGNYHEYNYGPLIGPNGNFMLTLNLAWTGFGNSTTDWRGWAVEVTPDGEILPFATGMRSPSGLGFNAEGDFFYGENQGDWVGSGYITHLRKGEFGGHPNGLIWAERSESPVKLVKADIPDTGMPRHEVGKDIEGFKLPAVWLPHGIMGISTSDIRADTTKGKFGPFERQLFVADQGHSKVMRAFLEKVDGEYQGAAFPFRDGFASGPLRLEWGHDGSLFAGQTARGWAATGGSMYSLQRLKWSGQSPVEIKEMRARPDGWELEFTVAMDSASIATAANYEMTGFTYKYHSTYGSPVQESETAPVKWVQWIDNRTVRLVVDNMRPGFIHELRATGLQSREGTPLLHPLAYYTLNAIPDGERVEVPAAAIAQAGSAITAPEQAQDDHKHVTEMPADWGSPDRTITIGVLPNLRFDRTDFAVRPGEKIKLVFANVDDMLHNLLVVKPGKMETVGITAMQLGLKGTEMDFVPRTEDVLFHTSLLQPESEEAIYFVAPDIEDDYPYVCTFPGHYITMNGVMTVSAATPA